MAHLITTFIHAFGYMGIFIAMILESACIPLPSEVIMPFGGYMAVLGHLNFWGVVICGTLGNLVGSTLAYALGRYGGVLLVMRYASVNRLSESLVEGAANWFETRGQMAVLVGRVCPIVRTFISLPAGFARMSFKRFILYTWIGAFSWTYLLTWAGTFLGKRWTEVGKYARPLIYIIIVAVLCRWAIYLAKRFIKSRSKIR